MKTRSAVMSIVLALSAGAFVWVTSLRLPAVVASHFDGSGMANGFMSRSLYVWFMLAFTVGLPLLLAFLPSLFFERPSLRFNLPHRDYWLAPERRAETVAFLCQHNARFAMLLMLFLCYVHWLVVRANGATPPRLFAPPFIAGLALFGVARSEEHTSELQSQF